MGCLRLFTIVVGFISYCCWWYSHRYWLTLYPSDVKTPWTDEFATLVFSLGNSFRTVPLEQAITLNTLLMLRPNPEASIRAVINHLMRVPIPGLLCIDSPMDEAVSYRRRTGHIVGSAITAILGAASIPAIFGMGWLVFALG